MEQLPLLIKQFAVKLAPVLVVFMITFLAISIALADKAVFDGPPCVPRQGMTALAIGQDYDSIRNYTAAVKGNRRPYAVMAYTALHNEHGALPGFSDGIDYGSGTEWVAGLHNAYPSAAIQLGLWFVGQSDMINQGSLDVYIDQLAAQVRGVRADFYIRIGYEFDSAENAYPARPHSNSNHDHNHNHDNNISNSSSNDEGQGEGEGGYVQAFRRIVDRFRASGVRNAAFVWHASGFAPRDGLQHDDWFPGRSYVDWCGVSIFQQPYACQVPTQCAMPQLEEFASFCKTKQLPLMIAESTPFGGIVDEKTASSDPKAHNEAGYRGSTWNNWFVPVLRFIEKYDVGMWSYINCNWDAQPMWRKQHAPGARWGDSRLQIHADVLARWEAQVLHSDRFSPLLNYADVLAAPDPSPTPTKAPTHVPSLDPTHAPSLNPHGDSAVTTRRLRSNSSSGSRSDGGATETSQGSTSSQGMCTNKRLILVADKGESSSDNIDKDGAGAGATGTGGGGGGGGGGSDSKSEPHPPDPPHKKKKKEEKEEEKTGIAVLALTLEVLTYVLPISVVILGLRYMWHYFHSHHNSHHYTVIH